MSRLAISLSFFVHAVWSCVICLTALMDVSSASASASANAQEPERQPIYSIEYQNKVISAPEGNAEALRVAKNIEALHLVNLSEVMTPFRTRVGVDQVFVSDNLDQAVFIRYGVKPVHETNPGSVYTDNAGNFLAHGKTKSELLFAAYFIGYKRTELNAILVDIQYSRNGLPTSKSAIGELLFPNANAKPILPPCESPKSFAQNADSLAKYILNHAGTCALSAVFGSASVFGKVWSTLLNVGSEGLAMTQGNSSLWEGVKSSWETSKRMLTDFKKVMMERYQGFFRLSQEKQTKLFCAVVASAATTAGAAVAISVSSGGTAAPVAFLAVNSVLSQLQNEGEFAEDLKKSKCQPTEDPDNSNNSSKKSSISK